jgi:hypothetical protein
MAFGRCTRETALSTGHFSKGKAHGPGAYIFPNGAYFKGEFYNS